jgi:putative ABC transport system permease protein
LESPLGHRIKIDHINYEVIGVLGKMGQFFTGFNFDNQVVIPITRLQTDFSWKPDLSILVKVADLSKMEDAREEVRGIMRQIRHLEPGDPDDFAINEQKAFLATFNRVAGSIALVGLFVTSLALFVGGIGIMNIMFVSVAERTREIGIRKALGARRRSILIQFLLEAATICLLGGLVGIALAWGLTLIVSRFLPASMSPAIVGAGLAVSLATGIISGFFPAWRAARMRPVDALRSD